MIYLVSFPRSGQHMLRNLLENMCKRYDVFFILRSDFMKNHDFALDTTCMTSQY